MPIINKVPHKKININLQGAIGIPSTDANILLIGHRNGVLSSTQPNYPQLKPRYGYPQLTAYQAYDLPSFSNGDIAISYMQSLGFTAHYGLSSSLVFPAPNAVVGVLNEDMSVADVQIVHQPKSSSKKRVIEVSDKSAEKSADESVIDKSKTNEDVDVQANVTLRWNIVPPNFELLVNSNKEITVKQTNDKEVATAKVQSVSVSPCQLVLTNVQGKFTNIVQITVSYIDDSVNVPDPERSDEICLMVYNAVNSINTRFPTTINTITPTISICFLNPNDTRFNPSPTPVQYLTANGTPAKISQIQKLPTGNIIIYFATTPVNFGITPLYQLGNTKLFKDEKVSGTLFHRKVTLA